MKAVIIFFTITLFVAHAAPADPLSRQGFFCSPSGGFCSVLVGQHAATVCLVFETSANSLEHHPHAVRMEIAAALAGPVAPVAVEGITFSPGAAV